MKGNVFMKSPKNRYVQPQSVSKAMDIIQNLFNQYRHQPLTDELLNYHLNLTKRLQTDIYITALKEDNKLQLAALKQMIVAMQDWTKIRTANRPFNYKMKNYKLISENSVKFKKRTHRIKGQHNYHSARH